jgi:alkylation response protein AidB-like acyl-CoA dehydrogenase
MDILIPAEQQQLRDVARDFFAARSPLPAVRELEGSLAGYAAPMWQEMADLDWLRLGHPESSGGAGGGLLDLVMLYLEMGRSLAPTPHLPAAVISASLLTAADGPAGRQLREQVLAGQAVVVPAITEESGDAGPAGIGLRATSGLGGYRLHGTKLLVPFAHSASHVIVAVRTAGGADGITLFLLESGSPGLTAQRLPNIAGYPLYALTFDSVLASGEAVLGQADQGWALLGPILDRAAVLRAAEIAGAGERLLELSVAYAHTRVQFGKPIGQYQAVQYLCSDIAIAAHLSLLFVLHAAGRADGGLSWQREAVMAKARASRAARLIARSAQDVYAGVAFMLESDIQLYTRRLKHWELDLGDDRFHRERITARLAG